MVIILAKKIATQIKRCIKIRTKRDQPDPWGPWIPNPNRKPNPAFYLLYRLEVPLTNEILINMSHSSESI